MHTGARQETFQDEGTDLEDKDSQSTSNQQLNAQQTLLMPDIGLRHQSQLLHETGHSVRYY